MNTFLRTQSYSCFGEFFCFRNLPTHIALTNQITNKLRLHISNKGNEMKMAASQLKSIFFLRLDKTRAEMNCALNVRTMFEKWENNLIIKI